MTLLILKYLHVIAFVYWLGGDLGTYIASNQVIKRDNSPEARHVALKIMLACDMGPKLSMPFIFILGVQMAQMMGIMNISDWAMRSLWMLTIMWFFNVAIMHFKEGTPLSKTVSRVDLWFRIFVAIGLVVWAIWGLANGEFAGDWFGWKLLIFAVMVFCGVMIRINLRSFIPAFSSMIQDGASEDTDSTMHRSLMRCRPYVWAIWLGLFVNAALGLHLIG